MQDNERTPKKRRRVTVFRVIMVLLLVAGCAFAIFRLSLRSKLKARIDAIRAAGYPVTCAELDKWYTTPEDAKNAAYIILDAFEYYQKPQDSELLPLLGKAELPARNIPLTKETENIIAQYLSDNQKTLEMLHEAAALEHGRYLVDLSFDLAPPVMNRVKGVKLLNLEAIIHAEKNESQSAIRSLTSSLGLAKSFSEEPIIVSQLSRISCQARTVSILERVMNRTDLTDEQLADLSQAVANAQEQSSLGISRAFVGERCQTLSVFRKPGSLAGIVIGSHGQTSDIPVPILEVYKALGLADMDAVDYLDMMKGYIKATQLPPHLRQEAVEAVKPKRESIPKTRILLRTFMPALDRIITMDLRNIAGLRTAQAAIAIQRYRLATGKFPETLNDLVPDYLELVPTDPFDGKELRYKKLETGYFVYSIGEDLSDDGGKEKPPRRTKESPNWDVTFIVER